MVIERHASAWGFIPYLQLRSWAGPVLFSLAMIFHPYTAMQDVLG